MKPEERETRGQGEGEKRKPRIVKHTDLEVHQRAFIAAMEVFRLSESFPPEERYSLTDQFSRATRSVCANLAEAWRKRRYEAAFISKLSDSEGEAAEWQLQAAKEKFPNFTAARRIEEMIVEGDRAPAVKDRASAQDRQ
jgi:four helix bundle protein